MGGDRHRYASPGQNWVSNARMVPNDRLSPSVTPAAGARPPVSHHLHLGAMVPKAMGFTPALQDGNFHRGWERPELTLDVTHSPSTPPRSTPPHTVQRIRSRVPIYHNSESQLSPPESQRTPPASQRSHLESQRSYRDSLARASPNPTPRPTGSGTTSQMSALQRGSSRLGAAGTRTPAGDHMNLRRGMQPAVGINATAFGGGGGVFFPNELQQNPAPLWHAGDQSSGYVHALRQPQVTQGVLRRPAASTEAHTTGHLSLYAA